MNAALKNWKTTAAGGALIAIAVLQLLGVAIPGVPHIDIGTAIIQILAGSGLVAASDAKSV